MEEEKLNQMIQNTYSFDSDYQQVLNEIEDLIFNLQQLNTPPNYVLDKNVEHIFELNQTDLIQKDLDKQNNDVAKIQFQYLVNKQNPSEELIQKLVQQCQIYRNSYLIYREYDDLIKKEQVQSIEMLLKLLLQHFSVPSKEQILLQYFQQSSQVFYMQNTPIYCMLDGPIVNSISDMYSSVEDTQLNDQNDNQNQDQINIQLLQSSQSQITVDKSVINSQHVTQSQQLQQSQHSQQLQQSHQFDQQQQNQQQTSQQQIYAISSENTTTNNNNNLNISQITQQSPYDIQNIQFASKPPFVYKFQLQNSQISQYNALMDKLIDKKRKVTEIFDWFSIQNEKREIKLLILILMFSINNLKIFIQSENENLIKFLDFLHFGLNPNEITYLSKIFNKADQIQQALKINRDLKIIRVGDDVNFQDIRVLVKQQYGIFVNFKTHFYYVSEHVQIPQKAYQRFEYIFEELKDVNNSIEFQQKIQYLVAEQIACNTVLVLSNM